ncbi:AFG1-like ATPase [Caerostris extrusa]|uniref:AFG1-like ATPase n=1 Tax=Caerostris extrusa TaxID=172846 RepID=A0AAV4NMU6_CAEEX|nr:AFG1-like ATPase [Caerostris extrusa]
MMLKFINAKLFLNSVRHKSFSKGGIVEAYWNKVRNNEISLDKTQLKVVDRLEELRDSLKSYVVIKPTLFSKLFTKEKQKSVQGIYLFGSVGCGKTMLMDLFYENCPLEKKKRTHFNSFMLDVHSRIHAYKKQTLKHSAPGKKNLNYDPIGPVAESICDDTWLLCLDEFQVQICANLCESIQKRHLF